jgi:glycosyltransferase involved in cell wall biosynthesis
VPARILYISYPLLTVSQESAGGAEQVLWTLEREFARRGFPTTVAASAGSTVSGELLPTGEPCTQADDFERRNREHQETIIHLLRRPHSFDLVHDMSGSFWTRAWEVEIPVLATLHLPRSFYAPQSFDRVPPNLAFNSVSQSQARSFSDVPNMLGIVPNGIALDRFAAESQPDTSPDERRGLLWLGRICEEKGPHLALEIAERVGMPITVAGQVYPFSYHQQYFEREIAPRLQHMPQAKLVVSPSAVEKRRLLRQARALLVTSLVEETSSLVAMEAAASGTPVIAFRRGALPEVVRDQVTGFLVDNAEEAARACERAGYLAPKTCIDYARNNFDSGRMAQEYAGLYERALSMCGATTALG